MAISFSAAAIATIIMEIAKAAVAGAPDAIKLINSIRGKEATSTELQQLYDTLEMQSAELQAPVPDEPEPPTV